MGGKEDDISVTVAQIFVERRDEPRKTIQDFYRKDNVYLYKKNAGKLEDIPRAN